MSRPMNFVMISPYLPANFETSAVRLHEAGFHTLGIADAPYHELSEGLRTHLTEYYRVDNMEGYDQVYRVVVYFAHKCGRTDHVESHNEYWLELDAQLHTGFNVFGYKTDDVLAVKTKRQMKKIFSEHGSRVVAGDVFHSDDETRVLAEKLGFPVIIKPNSDVDASDTYKIRSSEELEAFFGYQSPKIECIMEEFIDSDIVTFNGLTNHDGEIVFYSSLEYSEAVLDTVERDDDMYYYVPRTIPDDLVALGKICVGAFHVKERFFYFEFFCVKETKKLMALEVNCRPPGGLTIDMWNYSNDFDIFREYANIVKDNLFEAEILRPYNVVYISRKANQTYAHSIDDIWANFGDNVISIQSIPGVFAKIMGEEGILTRIQTVEETRELAQYAQAKA